METRPLGETGHDSSVLTFGSIALEYLDQMEANEMVEDILDAGDPRLVPTLLEAAKNYEPMREEEQARLRERAADRDSPVPAP